MSSSVRFLLHALLLLGAGAISALGQEAVDVGPIDERPLAWHVNSFLEDANLQGSAIFVIDFESDGTAWVAASDGLYRYDGYRWDHYTTDQGLPSNYVRCVRVTRGGELWVGTDRGAGVFDGKSFDWRESRAHLAGPSVRRIVEDPDGTLWFACDTWPPSDVPAGLTRLRDGAWTTWRAEDGLPSDYVSDVFRDSRGDHFILTRQGLARLADDGRFERPIEEAGLEQCRDYIWSMVETPEGELVVTTTDWVCVRTSGHWRAVPNRSPRIILGQQTSTRDGAVVACTAGATAAFARWTDGRFVPTWGSHLYSGGGVHYVIEAPDGAIWIGGPDLLASWERRGSEWRGFDDLPPPRLRDADGGVWFGETGRVLRLAEDRWSRLPGASMPLAADRSNGVWMRTTGGLARWRADGVETFPETTIGVTNPRTISIDGADDLWTVGRCPDGRECVARHDGESWTVFELADIKPHESVVHGAPDSRQGMWYVVEDADSEGYRLFRVGDDGVVDVPLPMSARRYWMPRVLPDRRRRLWLYGLMGLYRAELDEGAREWHQVTEIPGRRVSSAVELKDELWFSYDGTTGGSGGVSRYRDDTWTQTSLPAPYLVRADADAGLVFAHSRGISLIPNGSDDPPSLVAVQEPERLREILPGPGRELWLAAGKQVLHFRPDGIPPETVIVDGEEEIRQGDDLVLHLRGVERFKSRTQPAPFNVAFQLDDGAWSHFRPLSEDRLSIGSPIAGEHTLRIVVQDQGGDIDPTPAEWHFRSLPIPLQDRVWFRPAVGGVALTLLILLGVSVVASRREMKARRKKQELQHEILEISEREQRRIGRDLHDGLGQRLTGISFQCHALGGMLAEADPASRQRAQEIEEAIRATIAEAKVLSRALYPADVDREELETVLGNLVASAARGFAGKCSYCPRSPPAELSRTDVLNVYRIVQEALNNAMRHARAQSVDVELTTRGNRWLVEVRDDGRGFDVSLAPDGMGLRIMRYRADQIGGKLTVESRPGGGTTVRCEVPVDK